jgi:spore maturation protein SpmA
MIWVGYLSLAVISAVLGGLVEGLLISMIFAARRGISS